MTRRRFIADEVSGTRAALVGDHARHLAHVLRAQIGQEFDISTAGEVRRGRITAVHLDRVEFELFEVVEERSPLEITVALSIFKFDRMEWAIEKCTELGVVRIVPVISARTERHLAAAAEKRVERWRRIAQQAAEQSRRANAPEIAPPIAFNQLLTMNAERKIVLCESEKGAMLRDALENDSGAVMLAFGPEGGWTEQEMTALAKNGWHSASLGRTILRCETAAIAAVAIAAALLSP